MRFKLTYLIFLFLCLSSIQLINSTTSEFDHCCRYGFEDGVRLNMLRENKNWSVIRTQNFNYCEAKVLFGIKAFRKCKTIGEEMALNCQIGMTCSNGKNFAEDQLDSLDKKTNQFGENLFKNPNLYRQFINDVDLSLDKQCSLLNLVYITPELQLSTFKQCCRSWTYNYNQLFYPDHFSLTDTCERINICLEKQNHTQFNFDNIKNQKDITKLKTENTLKIIHEQMKLENIPFINQFDEVVLKKEDPSTLNRNLITEFRLLNQNNSSNLVNNLHRNKLRNINDERKIHMNNISDYELQIRKVPIDKFKYLYCNKLCKDIRQLDYNESDDFKMKNNLINNRKKEFNQCFHNYSTQFCAKPIDCSIGFIPNYNNTICIELNECELKLDDCLKESEDCINHNEGYSCECGLGFRYDQFKNKCVNINECEEQKNICPDNSYCVDLTGSYECKCYEGLFKDDFGQCSQFANQHDKNNQKKKPATNEETTILHFATDKNQTESPTDDDKLLAEKLKFEKENLDKLKKGQLANGKPIVDDMIEDESDKLLAEKLKFEKENLDKLNNRESNNKLSEQQSKKTLLTTIKPENLDKLNNRESNNKLSEQQSKKTLLTTIKPENLLNEIEKNREEQLKEGTVKENINANENEKNENEKNENEKNENEKNENEKNENEKNENEKKRTIINKERNEEIQTLSSNANEKSILSPLTTTTTTKPTAKFHFSQDFNPCPLGYYLTESYPRKCLDIDECSNPNLNDCKNSTCINLPGTYECKSKDECPKEYKDINLNLVTSEQHYHEQSTRTSTYVFLLILACFIIFITIVFTFTYFIYRRFSHNYDVDL